MRIKLLRDARIIRKAGEIVEVSPAEGEFLLSVGSAEKIVEKATAPAVEVAEKAVKAPKAIVSEQKPAAKNNTVVRNTKKK